MASLTNPSSGRQNLNCEGFKTRFQHPQRDPLVYWSLTPKLLGFHTYLDFLFSGIAGNWHGTYTSNGQGTEINACPTLTSLRVCDDEGGNYTNVLYINSA